MADQENRTELLIYTSPDGKTRIDVRLQDETVWLSQAQLSELFQTTKQNISLHIKNVFDESELQENSVVKEYLTTAPDGKRYLTKFYNLDVIISVGYRVRSLRGTQFRIWATQRLREYIIKGFTLDDERLKDGGVRNDYFDELIQRVREIRTSERNFYQAHGFCQEPLATWYIFDWRCGLPSAVPAESILRRKCWQSSSRATDSAETIPTSLTLTASSLGRSYAETASTPGNSESRPFFGIRQFILDETAGVDSSNAFM